MYIVVFDINLLKPILFLAVLLIQLFSLEGMNDYIKYLNVSFANIFITLCNSPLIVIF